MGKPIGEHIKENFPHASSIFNWLIIGIPLIALYVASFAKEEILISNYGEWISLLLIGILWGGIIICGIPIITALFEILVWLIPSLSYVISPLISACL